MNPALMGYGAAVLSSLDGPARRRVAEELGALEAAVAADPALRAALTDTSIAAGPRRAVVADLLEGKVSPEAARIAAFAAYSSPPVDVPLALGEAAHRAREFAEDGTAEEPALSVLASRARVGGYAAAVFEDTGAEALDGVEDDLFHWALTVAASPPLRRALTNRDLAGPARAGLVTELLSSKAKPVTLRLASYAVVGGRPRDLVSTLNWLVDRVADERGWRVARVRTAQPIDEATTERLAATLRTLVGRPVDLEVERREDLLGGVLVEVGDLRVDATVRRRLEALREHLLADRSVRSYAPTIATQGAN